MPATVMPLAELLMGSGALPADKAFGLAWQLATQLAELHARGRLHLRIDLAAVAIDEQGQAVLSVPEGDCELGLIDGSALELPPEFEGALPQILPRDFESAQAVIQTGNGHLDPRRIDIYQLGALLCRLLTGGNVETYLQSALVMGRIPSPAREIVDRALGFDPGNRYASAKEFATALLLASESRVGAEGKPPAHDTSPSLAGLDRQSDTSTGRKADKPPATGGDLPFTRLGDYEIVGRLGSGGMGDVYEGFEPRLKRHVAIKVLPAELARHEDFVRRFHAEASAAAQLSHPHIVTIHFIGEDAGRHFFVMEYVKGESLADLLKRRSRLAADETLPIIEQALLGLAAAHKQGLVHRDIKPANLLIDRENERVLLADFGIAKSLAEGGTITSTGMVLGTADYISPEQARGQPVDGRSDLYSVGAMLFQMLTGRLPFEADSATALIFKHVYDPPPNLAEIAPHLPEQLAGVVMRLLAKSPADRYASAGDVLADLRMVPGPHLAERRGPRQTSIVKAPVFADLPLPTDAVEPPRTGWFKKLKRRAFHDLRRQAPALADRLQDTQQQVDGAVFEYERRCANLRQLVQEADAVVAELRRQSHEQRSAAATLESAAEVPAQQHADCLTTADELERQAAEQEEELTELRLRLAQANATLLKLRGQRDALGARLRAAQAQWPLESGPAGRRFRWRIVLYVAMASFGTGLVLLSIMATTRLPIFSRTPAVASPDASDPQPSNDDKPSDPQPSKNDKPPDPAPAQYSLQLGNGDDSLRIERTAGLVEFRNLFTVEYLVRFAPEEVPHLLLSTYGSAERIPGVKKTSGTVGCKFRFGTTGFSGDRLLDGLMVGGGPAYYGSFLAARDNWQHVAFCCDGKNVAFYMHGKRIQTGTSHVTDKYYEPSPLDLNVGNHDYTFEPRDNVGLNARLRALRVSRTCRYPGPFTPPANLELDEQTEVLLDFSKRSSGPIPDLSGNGHHGVLRGGKWVADLGAVNSAGLEPAGSPPYSAPEHFTIAFIPANENLRLARIGDRLRQELGPSVRWVAPPAAPPLDEYELAKLFIIDAAAPRLAVAKRLQASALVLVRKPKGDLDTVQVLVSDGYGYQRRRESLNVDQGRRDIEAEVAQIVKDTLGAEPSPQSKFGILRAVAPRQPGAEAQRVADQFTFLLKKELANYKDISWADETQIPRVGAAQLTAEAPLIWVTGESGQDDQGQCFLTLKLLAADKQIGQLERKNFDLAQAPSEVHAGLRELLKNQSKSSPPAPGKVDGIELARQAADLRGKGDPKAAYDFTESATLVVGDSPELRFQAFQAALTMVEAARQPMYFDRVLVHLERFADLGGVDPKFLRKHGYELKLEPFYQMGLAAIAWKSRGPMPGFNPAAMEQRACIERIIVSLTKQKHDATLFWNWLMAPIDTFQYGFYDQIERIVGQIESLEYGAEQMRNAVRAGGPLSLRAPPAQGLLKRLSASPNAELRKLAEQISTGAGSPP